MTKEKMDRTYAPRACLACAQPFTPTGPRGRLCLNCVSVPAGPRAKAKSNGKSHAPAVIASAPEPEPQPQTTTFDALEVIDAFALDFNVGNAVRFLLEKHDGDELANLRAAHAYLERAIARVERSAA